jgi:hypothetical protein
MSAVGRCATQARADQIVGPLEEHLALVGRTPSMSPITAIGSGAAMSRTKSHSPRSHTASINVSHSEPIDGLCLSPACG